MPFYSIVLAERVFEHKYYELKIELIMAGIDARSSKFPPFIKGTYNSILTIYQIKTKENLMSVSHLMPGNNISEYLEI